MAESLSLLCNRQRTRGPNQMLGRMRSRLLGSGIAGVVPDGSLASGVAELTDTANTTTTGDVTIADGVADFGGTAVSRVTIGSIGLSGGNWWAHAVMSEWVPGSSRVRGLSATHDPLATRARGFHQVYKLPSLAGSASLDFLAATNFDGTLERIQLVDQEETLAQPWDIWVLAGQSNMACTTSGTPLDKDEDGWADQRLMYFPGDNYTATGSIKDDIEAARGPLVAAAISGGAFLSNPANAGVSPGLRFGQHIVQHTSPNRSVVLVQTAVSGTDLEGTGAAWNPNGSTGDGALAYNAMVARVNAAIAAAPAGSVVRGVIWAQGEGDTSSDMSTYPASWATMRSAAETAFGTGQLPWFILLGPPDASRLNQAEFRRVQSAMETGSGGPEEQPDCYAVDRPSGYMEDSTHVTAEGNRIAGARIAAAVLGQRILDRGV